MSKTIAIATALLLGTASLAVAQTTNKAGTAASPGASPGQEEMQDSTTTTAPGASATTQGTRARNKGTVGQSSTKGMTDPATGDRMNDPRKH